MVNMWKNDGREKTEEEAKVEEKRGLRKKGKAREGRWRWYNDLRKDEAEEKEEAKEEEGRGLRVVWKPGKGDTKEEMAEREKKRGKEKR